MPCPNTIRWTIKDYRRSNDDVKELLNDASPEQLTSLMTTDLEAIIFTTDSLGAFLEIKNIDEIQRVLQTSFEIAIDRFTKGLSEAEKQQVLGPFSRVTAAFQNPAVNQERMFGELLQLLSPMGGAFPAREPLEYQDSYVSPLTDGPIRMEGILYFDSLDIADDYAHLKQLTQLNEEDIAAAITEFLGSIMPEGKGEELEEALRTAKFEVSDDNDFLYYYYPGIPIYVDCMRVMDISLASEKSKRIERTLITWVE